MKLISPSETSRQVSGGVEDTVGLLDAALAGLHGLLRQLVGVTTEKLAAIRSADAAGLHRCAVREAELLNDVFAGEAHRDAVLARLAQQVLAPQPGKPRLAALIDALPEPPASRIRARNAGLQQIAGELQKKNALVADVARRLQRHLRGIFADLAKAQTETVVYGRNGQHEQSTTRAWVDAVG